MEKALKFHFSCFLLFIISFKIIKSEDQSQYRCAQQINEGCADNYRPTQQELNRARDYIQKQFMEKASYPPDIAKIKPCPQIYVRKNFKCMSHEERLRLIRVFKRVYKSGLMWELADIHAKCWAPWHKSLEAVAGHRIIVNKLEKAMIKLDPKVTIPYWSTPEDCENPERSIIWEYFGTCGTNATDWCVTDGPFTEETKDHQCIKRQWNQDGTISPWYCPDIENIGLSPPIYMVFFAFSILNLHFHPHISIGGWNGHYSQNWAPYDAIFPIHHLYYSDCLLLKMQLNYRFLLAPTYYNLGWSFDQTTHQMKRANIGTDIICHYNTSVLDMWYYGFGDQCVVCDKVIKAINQKLDNQKTDPKPIPQNNVMNSIANLIRWQLFPVLQNFKPLITFDSKTPDLSKCNPKCRPMPLPPKYSDTPEGRRQIKAFIYDWGRNMGPLFSLPDLFLRGLIRLLNFVGYCSPYVTSVDNRNTTNYPVNLNDLPSIENLNNILNSFQLFVRNLFNGLK